MRALAPLLRHVRGARAPAASGQRAAGHVRPAVVSTTPFSHQLRHYSAASSVLASRADPTAPHPPPPDTSIFDVELEEFGECEDDLFATDDSDDTRTTRAGALQRRNRRGTGRSKEDHNSKPAARNLQDSVADAFGVSREDKDILQRFDLTVQGGQRRLGLSKIKSDAKRFGFLPTEYRRFLSRESEDELIAKIYPAESEAVSYTRQKLHKELFKCVHPKFIEGSKSSWGGRERKGRVAQRASATRAQKLYEFRRRLEVMNGTAEEVAESRGGKRGQSALQQVPFDEITYCLAIYGSLLTAKRYRPPKKGSIEWQKLLKREKRRRNMGLRLGLDPEDRDGSGAWDAFMNDRRSLEVGYQQACGYLGQMLEDCRVEKEKPEPADDAAEATKKPKPTKSKGFHPALLRLHESFLRSYGELLEIDAQPNRRVLLKVLLAFHNISVVFKRRRMKALKHMLRASAWMERDRLELEKVERLNSGASRERTGIQGDGGVGVASNDEEPFSLPALAVLNANSAG